MRNLKDVDFTKLSVEACRLLEDLRSLSDFVNRSNADDEEYDYLPEELDSLVLQAQTVYDMSVKAGCNIIFSN